jgi:hypothetical protein
MKNESEYTVHLGKDGVTHTVPPGEEFPDWAKPENPYVTGKLKDEDGHPQEAPAVFSGPPPRAGKGSGVEPWAAYAASQGVEVEDGAGRDEIVAACEDAGVAVD